MEYLEFVEEVREDLSENLNSFLVENYSLEPIQLFCDNGYDVMHKAKAMAVYASSPSGSIITQSNHGIEAKVTVEFHLNDSADKASTRKIERYFGAISNYLSRQTYGEFSLMTDSLVRRMDIGDVCNEALFLITSRIKTTTDSHFTLDYDI